MTSEILKAKAIQAKHFSCVKPEYRKPKRNDYLLISAEHLFKINHAKKLNNEKSKNNKHSNLVSLIVRLAKVKRAS